MKKILVLLLIFTLLFSSCMSNKKILYLQGSQNSTNNSNNYEPIIQNDDRLSIRVNTLEIEASFPFNLEGSQNNSGNYRNPINSVNSSNNNSNNSNIGYLVDQKGTIDFPVIGTINVAGFTIDQVKILLKEKLSVYLKDPIVNIQLLNFKVTILGDVASPGIKIFNSNRVTLLDAIGASYDLTIFGKRTNILLIRDFQGVKTFNRIDITKADFVNSPFYYLDQNDVIYIESRKAKVDATALPNLSIIVSVVSFISTLLFLIIKK
ncbi:polysaccharide biosynthesis/export family protein [Flavobacterium sp.]|uniref:polysaccharide biosynthesis/export family protein n=1 Tax=Flavobacterium sp. TaxID=239 RepID=UPI003BBA8FA8